MVSRIDSRLYVGDPNDPRAVELASRGYPAQIAMEPSNGGRSVVVAALIRMVADHDFGYSPQQVDYRDFLRLLESGGIVQIPEYFVYRLQAHVTDLGLLELTRDEVQTAFQMDWERTVASVAAYVAAGRIAPIMVADDAAAYNMVEAQIVKLAAGIKAHHDGD